MLNIKPFVSNVALRAGMVSDIDTSVASRQEAGAYNYRIIAPGFFLCIHGDNGYVISESMKTIGCSCPDMTFRKTHQDVCKHILAFASLDYPVADSIDTEMVKLLMQGGWTEVGSILCPPRGERKGGKAPEPPKSKAWVPHANAKVQEPPAKAEVEKPEAKKADAQPDRRQQRNAQDKWKGMTPAEMCQSMDDKELRANARRGGVAAIAEMKRRKAES